MTEFATGADGPVDIEMGPDGNIYYVAIRPDRSVGSATPSAIPRPSPTQQAPDEWTTPLAVQFSSAGSSDPDGDPLTYRWNFGDGTPTSDQANPQHTYTTNGTYTATLDRHRRPWRAHRHGTVTITVGNRRRRRPSPRRPRRLYKVGDVITYSGSATDPERAPLPGRES